jgi:signal recognition particle subunit SRP54
MVLADLGRRLTSAIGELNRSPVVDEALLDATLKSVAAALLASDVNVKLVSQLRNRVKAKVVPQLDGKLGQQSQKAKAVVQKVSQTNIQPRSIYLSNNLSICRLCTMSSSVS